MPEWAIIRFNKPFGELSKPANECVVERLVKAPHIFIISWHGINVWNNGRGGVLLSDEKLAHLILDSHRSINGA